MTYEVKEGEYTTFTATENDPAMELPTPDIKVADAAYLVIEYRTTAKVMGEIYIARNDGVSFSQDAASHLEWNWTPDGEWHKLIVHCEGWADVQDAVFTQLRLDPLHMHQGIKAGDAIELRYFAFFDSEEKAQAFDFAAYKEYAKQVLNGIPVGYAGAPQDCNGLILMLCSDAGRYITGTDILIDGGMSL